MCGDDGGDGGALWERGLSEGAECPPLSGSRLTDVLQRTGRWGVGIQEEFDSVRRYLSIFTRSCNQLTPPPPSHTPLVPPLQPRLTRCLHFLSMQSRFEVSLSQRGSNTNSRSAPRG